MWEAKKFCMVQVLIYQDVSAVKHCRCRWVGDFVSPKICLEKQIFELESSMVTPDKGGSMPIQRTVPPSNCGCLRIWLPLFGLRLSQTIGESSSSCVYPLGVFVTHLQISLDRGLPKSDVNIKCIIGLYWPCKPSQVIKYMEDGALGPWNEFGLWGSWLL
jgi:hypothetical protein